TQCLSSTVSLPLVSPADQAIGVLVLKAAGRDRTLSSDEQDALQLFAAQFAAAVERSQYQRRLQRSIDAFVVINEAGPAVESILGLEGGVQQDLGVATRLPCVITSALLLDGHEERLPDWQ